jgi:hypothetical protein
MAKADIRQEAARSALSRQLELARKGRSILYPFIGRSTRFEAWRHYPTNDAMDMTGAWQFYYHAHDDSREGGARHPQEHGHIHLFRRDELGRLSHLAGLSLDARGTPLSWFATNQWVTGERWMAARPLAQGINDMKLRLRGPLSGVALWLADMVRVYVTPLRDMLQARDEALAGHCERHQFSRARAWADRRVAVWSSCPIHWPQDALQLSGQVSVSHHTRRSS